MMSTLKLVLHPSGYRLPIASEDIYAGSFVSVRANPITTGQWDVIAGALPGTGCTTETGPFGVAGHNAVSGEPVFVLSMAAHIAGAAGQTRVWVIEDGEE